MRRLKMPWMAFLLALCLGPGSSLAASVSAGASSYELSDSQTHPTAALAHIERHGPGAPGSSAATGTAAFAALAGMTTTTGCGFAVNNFQQVCNQSFSGAGFTDMINITANAPNGTLVQVRATLDLDGSIHGIGAYSWSVDAGLNGEIRGMNGGTGGGVVTVNNLVLDDSRVWTVNLVVGVNYVVNGSVQTQTANRFCAGGTQDCDASDSDWRMTVVAATKLKLEILTTGIGAQVVSQSGHDYLATPLAVAPHGSPGARLGMPWPNPSRGPVDITLALETESPVDVGVFDLAGRRVTTLAHATLPAGSHTLRWDGRNATGRDVTGLFFVRAKGQGVDLTRRVLMR